MSSSSRPQSGRILFILYANYIDRKSLMDTAFAAGRVSNIRRLSRIPSGTQTPLSRRISRLSNPGTPVVHTNPVRKLVFFFIFNFFNSLQKKLKKVILLVMLYRNIYLNWVKPVNYLQ